MSIEYLKYRLFQYRTNLELAWFILRRNREWDYSFFILIQIKKLTMMGKYFHNYGFTIEEDRRKIVRSIWKARRHLLNFNNSSEKLGNKADSEILRQIKKPYNTKLISDKKGEYYNCIIKTEGYTIEEEEKAKSIYNSIAGYEIETKYQKDELEQAFEIIRENIIQWWD